MPTFLDSHFKIQQLESRLSKNEYLSNECLPNHIDAKVFKALKTSDKIPKRELYPNFYHWYILMRQFSNSTLEHWLRNRENECKRDSIVSEVVRVINEISPSNIQSPSSESDKKTNILRNTLTKDQAQLVFIIDKCLQENAQDSYKEPSTSSLLPTISLPNQSSINTYSIEEFNPFSTNEITFGQLPKVSSHIEKKPKSLQSTVTSFIMDIKLSSQIGRGYQTIKKMFEVQTVKLQTMKAINHGNDSGFDLRVLFLTVESVCEQLKIKILSCANVQTIQCKKQKRNQSL